MNHFKDFLFEKIIEYEIDLYDDEDYMYVIHMILTDYIIRTNLEEFHRIYLMLYDECKNCFSNHHNLLSEFIIYKSHNNDETE